MAHFKFGVEVEDKVTKFKGIVTAKIEYINGCVKYEVSPGLDKDGKMQEGYWLDHARLVKIGDGVKVEVADIGGEVVRVPLNR